MNEVSGWPRDGCVSNIYAPPGYQASGGRGLVECCVDALAEGACEVPDLCPTCRAWLIEVTDRAAGYPLPWRRVRL